jgi:hypothetical protein
MNVSIGVLLVPLLLPVVLFAIALVWWLPRSRPTVDLDPSRQIALLAWYRKAVRWRLAGFGLGVVVACVTAVTVRVGLYNLGAMLAPTVFGLCVTGGVVLGELKTIPPRQGIRTAALEPRTIGHYLPKWLGGLVAASSLGLGALLVMTTLMGSADDQGHPGRFLARQCSPEVWARNGPWPGSFYSLPLAIALVVGLLGAAMALRAIVMRPRSGSDPGLVAFDDVLRRRSTEAVVAAAGVMVAASLSGVALVAGMGLHRAACAPAVGAHSWTFLSVALLGVGSLMLPVAAWCLALLLAGPRIPVAQPGDTLTDQPIRP